MGGDKSIRRSKKAQPKWKMDKRKAKAPSVGKTRPAAPKAAAVALQTMREKKPARSSTMIETGVDEDAASTEADETEEEIVDAKFVLKCLWGDPIPACLVKNKINIDNPIETSMLAEPASSLYVDYAEAPESLRLEKFESSSEHLGSHIMPFLRQLLQLTLRRVAVNVRVCRGRCTEGCVCPFAIDGDYAALTQCMLAWRWVAFLDTLVEACGSPKDACGINGRVVAEVGNQIEVIACVYLTVARACVAEPGATLFCARVLDRLFELGLRCERFIPITVVIYDLIYACLTRLPQRGKEAKNEQGEIAAKPTKASAGGGGGGELKSFDAKHCIKPSFVACSTTAYFAAAMEAAMAVYIKLMKSLSGHPAIVDIWPFFEVQNRRLVALLEAKANSSQWVKFLKNVQTSVNKNVNKVGAERVSYTSGSNTLSATD